jgi:hypothetical protein
MCGDSEQKRKCLHLRADQISDRGTTVSQLAPLMLTQHELETLTTYNNIHYFRTREEDVGG